MKTSTLWGRLLLFLLGFALFLAFMSIGALAWLLLNALFAEWWPLALGASVAFGLAVVIADFISEHRR